MQSNILEAFGSVLKAFGGVFHWFSLVFIGFQAGRAGRDTFAGSLPGRRRMAGTCLGGRYLAGGQEALLKGSKNPSKASASSDLCLGNKSHRNSQVYVLKLPIHRMHAAD